MLAAIRAALAAVWAIVRPLLRWIVVAIVLIGLAIVLIGPLMSGAVWLRNATITKWQEWETVWNAPWPTPAPPVRSIAPAPFIGGSSSTTGIATICEFDYRGTRVTAPNSRDLQWFTLNNANRILLVCNGRIQHVFAEIPPEHFNDWMLYLPPELQNMTVPDMASPALPQATPAPTRAPQSIAPQPAPASLDCPVFGAVKTTPIGDGGCLYKGTVVTDNVPTNWWAWWGIPAHRQDSGSITANQVSFYPN